jgi:pimeloyl-ACP methyl ester carboxylesterase
LHGVHNSTYSTAKSATSQENGEPVHIGEGDEQLAVTRWPGAGPIVVLVHGIGSSGDSWRDLIPALGQHFTPVTMDLRGHGASGKPASGYLYDDYVSDLDRVLDALGLDAPLLVGHSLGGIVTLWWAARHPDRAKGIVVVDSPMRSGEDFRPAFDGWIAQNTMTPDELTAWYLEKHPEWGEERARRRALVMTGTAPNVFMELKADSLAHDGADRIGELTGITTPLLLVHGDVETGSLVHPDDIVAFQERVPNASAAHTPGAGHGLHRERMDEFLAYAVPFLRKHSRR